MKDLDEAIQSLVHEMEKQAVLGHIGYVENLSQMAEWLRELKAYKEQDGDAISRQAVIELYEGWWLGHIKEDDFVTEVRALPPVTPQPIECEERKSGNCPFYAN